MTTLPSALAALPSLGLVGEPSPLQALEPLAASLGVGELWVKRDDAIVALGGGSKVRKLDVLLAQARFQRSARWHTSGARGSGHLLVCSRAAALLGHELIAHACYQPHSERVESTFASTRATASKVELYDSRLSMSLRRPYLMVGESWRGDAIIAPGGSSPAGTSAFVQAAFELVDQARAKGMAMPDSIYIPIGSGGAAMGLAIGLALAGAATHVHAVATVERVLVSAPRLAALKFATLHWLRSQGVPVPRNLSTKLVIDSSQIGKGYAHPTRASRAAVSEMAEHGLSLESVYSGKAMAALRQDASQLAGKQILFWLTCQTLAPLARSSSQARSSK